MSSIQYDESEYDSAIAIVGMAGRFPGAPDVATFWQNIAGGVQSIRFFSPEELQEKGIEPALLTHPQYVPASAPLAGIERFDAAFFGYTPREAATMDPQHRVFLECAWEALEHAGYDPSTHRGLVGVFAGSAFCSYLQHNLYPYQDLMEELGQLQIDANHERDALASRVSYKLNLRGPSLAVQTFCSTSLVAAHLACQSLLNYESDMALAGGVAIRVPHEQGYLYEEGGLYSPDGQCRSFDASAQGYVPGSGAGVVTLKRFRDAQEDRDTIYALIRGSATNNDGSVRVSYTAPGVDGQANAILGALSYAGLSAESISYIEAHGTGTRLGDAVELTALRKAFETQTDQKQFCAIGSVKPNIGHLDRASGVTSLIKATLALHHRQLPPSLNFEQSSPENNLDDSPFYINTALRPWAEQDSPRRAGVSCFGIGGANAHMILEEAPERPAGQSEQAQPWQLLTLSARTESALQEMSRNLGAYLGEHPELALADVAHTLQTGRARFAHRRVLVGQETAEVVAALCAQKPERAPTASQDQRERGVAFLFPDSSEDAAALNHDLYTREPAFREAVEQCYAHLAPSLQRDVRQVLSVSGPARTAPERGRASSPRRTGALATAPAEVCKLETQLAAFISEYALARLFMQRGIQPQAMLGYGLGEYVAACLAGVISLEDALKLVTARAQVIQEGEAETMIAVSLTERSVQAYLDDLISLVAVNGPANCVLAGPAEAVDMLEEQLNDQGIFLNRLEQMRPRPACSADDALTSLAAGLTLRAPTTRYISTVTGTWITDEQATDPAYWAQHLSAPIRFADGLDQLSQEQSLALLEIGSGQTLSNLAQKHPAFAKDQQFMAIAALPSRQEPGSKQVVSAIGSLWLANVALDWEKAGAGGECYRVPLPTYPFERQRHWIDAPRQGLPRYSWSAREAQPTRPGEAGGEQQSPWLVFVDQDGPGAALAHSLRQSGQICVSVSAGPAFACQGEMDYTIRPAEAEDYAALYKTLAAAHLLPRTVLRCWNVSALTEGADEALALQALAELVKPAGGQPSLTMPARSAPVHAQPQEAAAPGALAARPEHLSTEYVAPGDEYEQLIVGAWQQVLGLEPIGIEDNFFELGGHSLIATQLIARLRHTLQVNLPLTLLFDASTPAALAAAIKLTLLEEIDQMAEGEASALV